MSEEQGKPKRYQIRQIYFYICVLVILLVIVGVCVMAAGGNPTPSIESGYYAAKTELQNAINDYQNRNNGALPTINGTVTINGSTYAIINICPLLTQDEESLQKVKDSLWCGDGSNDDNWDNGCAECTTWSSYVWAVDDEGNVYSTCVGKNCNASGIDGYQGVWP